MIPVFLWFNDFAVVLLSNGFGESLCPANFIVAFFFAESNGEGLIHIGNSSYIAGIHTAGEEGTDFYIGNLVCLHGIVEGIRDAVYPIVQCWLFICLEVNAPITLDV